MTLASPTNDATLSSGGRLVTSTGETLPLRETRVSARARGGIAHVVLEQTFVNDRDEPLLVHYELPLPADGAVGGFAFRMDGRRIIGEVDTKHRARERFEEAIVRGQTAALVEQQRSNQFHQEVGNVPPGSEIVCEILVDQKLAWLAEGAWEWRFPTVLGPRYMGEPGRVEDAAALNVPYDVAGIDTRAHLELTIADAIPSGAPSSPSHQLRPDRVGSETRVELSDPSGARLDSDIVVRWPVSTPDVGIGLDLARPASERFTDGDAFGLLTLVPPTPESKPRATPRDLIFLIDTSGSMGGEPLQQAQRVVCAMIDTLADQDRVELIEFGSRPRRFKSEPLVATREGKRAATKWVKGLRASGGTEMHTAVLEALAPLRMDAQRQVVLITDGYIGFENEIIRTVLARLPSNSRLHTLGVGSAPNRSLTGPAARAGGGVEIVVGLGQDAEVAAKRLLERTTAPLVTELKVTGDGLTCVPSRLPDLYAGSPSLIGVRVPAACVTLTVTGKTAAGEYRQEVAIPAVEIGAGNPGVTKLYGREWVEDLETRRACGNGVREIDASVEDVGLRFQIATRMTSWVAVDEEVSVKPGVEPREEIMPHEIPYGTSVEGIGLRATSAPLEQTRAGVMAPMGDRAKLRRARPARPAKKEEAVRSMDVKYSRFDLEGGEADELAIEDAPGFAEDVITGEVALPPAEEAPAPEPVSELRAEPEMLDETAKVAPRQQLLAEASDIATPKARTQWWLIILLVVLMLLAAGLGLWILLDSGGDATAPVAPTTLEQPTTEMD
jgi:Ca-activated chloride channel family protein